MNNPYPSPKKFFYVKRDDAKHNGSVVEIPEESLAATLRNHPTWKVIDESREEETQATIEDAPVADTLECLYCGWTVATDTELKKHKEIVHPDIDKAPATPRPDLTPLEKARAEAQEKSTPAKPKETPAKKK